MQGNLGIFHQTDSVPIGTTADGTERFLATACWIFDPALFPVAKPKIRFGGTLIGTGTIVFLLRKGGTHAAVDGTLLASSPVLNSPVTPFQWDMPETDLGASLLRLKVTYVATGTVSLADFYLLLHGTPPVVAVFTPDDGFRIRGEDIDCITDVNTAWNLVGGNANIGRAIVRRLTTPRGSLVYDAHYGLDIRDYLKAGMTDGQISRIRSDVESEVLKDPRIQGATARVEPNVRSGSMKITLSLDLATGPFELLLGVDALTVEILDESLV